MRRAVAFFALVAAAFPAMAGQAAAQERARFDTDLLARIEIPGYPASAYPHPNGRVYVGTYTNPSGDTQPSRVFEFTSVGTLLRSWVVPGQDLAAEHGIQAATSDAAGRLVLLDRTPSRALILDRRTGEFSQYATFADLPPCPPTELRPDCSPTAQDLKPVANFAAWAPDGGLLVSDFHQGVIWRVPPGGGTARVWLSDRRLDGNQFGTTGIGLAADRRTLIIAQGSSAGLIGLGGNPTTGKIYTTAIGADGDPGPLTQLWESGPAELPDGFGIAQSGRLYVALAGANQIAVIGPDGREEERFPSGPDGDNGSPAPFDTPSSAKFLGTRLMVPNQAFTTGNTENQTLLDVETREPGLAELIPGAAGGVDAAAPALTGVAVRPRVFAVARRGSPMRAAGSTPRGARIGFAISERATVRFSIERLRGGRWSRVFAFSRSRSAGAGSIALSGRYRAGGRTRSLQPGRHRVVLTATDAAGNLSPRVAAPFRVVRVRPRSAPVFAGRAR